VSSVPPITPRAVRAELVETGDQVAAVVHRQLRMTIEHRVDVVVVALVVLALDREDRDGLIVYEGSGHVILVERGFDAQREHRRPAGAQGLQEIRRSRSSRAGRLRQRARQGGARARIARGSTRARACLGPPRESSGGRGSRDSGPRYLR